jgi:DNA-binding PadR family transcriptional regulator
MSPVFAHGQLRLYLLALLDEAPRHGYELIRALEDRFEGMYAPSAGTIYPRLSRLEEDGLVEREEQGRKAIYRITEAGRAEVTARRGDLADIQREVNHSVREMADQLRSQVRSSAADLRSELAGAAAAARSTADTAPPSASASASTSASARATRLAAVHSLVDLERDLDRLRKDLRTAVRRHRLTAEQVEEVRAALAEAGRRIAAALTGR